MNYQEAQAEVERFNAARREGGREPSHLAVVVSSHNLTHQGPLELTQRVFVIVASARRYVMPVYGATAAELRAALKRACEVLP